MIDLNVSRETQADLEKYLSELLKWNAKINLIAKSTEPDAARRHILDSLQLVDAAPARINRWLDMGSGGGLPIVVAAIALKATDTAFIAIESDERKAIFLKHIAVTLDLNLDVHAERIQAVDPQAADVISARALAPLATLLSFAQMHGRSNVICLFPKGSTFQEELASARLEFRFNAEPIPSKTSAGSVCLRIKDIEHV